MHVVKPQKGVRMQEIYISTDVEADGPIPGQNSMLSFGSAAYLKNKELISTFEVNLECIEGAVADPETEKWWSKQKEAWDYCRNNLQKPDQAMKNYVEWIEGLPGKPVFVGFPVSYDFMFVYWYLMKFVGRSPFSYSALDIKTLAMVAMKSDYREATKKNMPKKWFDKLPYTHKALDDAINQGALFCNILAELESA
jgi:DNA polymerase III alpha subunit (gram-positive type)